MGMACNSGHRSPRLAHHNPGENAFWTISMRAFTRTRWKLKMHQTSSIHRQSARNIHQAFQRSSLQDSLSLCLATHRDQHLALRIILWVCASLALSFGGPPVAATVQTAYFVIYAALTKRK